MLFLIEIEKFRESLKPDRTLWPGNYKEIDNIIDINPDKVWTWKARVNLESVMKQVKFIYDTFINEGSEHQICVSTAMLARTNRRVELIAAYGRETFHEISLDPFRTLEKDILPRFVNSPTYRQLCEKLESITHLPDRESLVVEPPNEHTDVIMGSSFGADRMFTLDEVLATQFLYNKFLSNLRAKMSNENLLCKRLIIIFKEKMTDGNREAASAIAWDIYRYFVAAHSAYEVSLEYMHKTDLKFHLAKPVSTMFDMLNRSVSDQLSADFQEFKTTQTYGHLARDLQVEVEQRLKAQHKGKGRSCFG